MADGEIVNPQDVYDVDGVDEPMHGEPQVIVEDPDQLEDEEEEFEDMDIDDEEEIGEVTEVGSDVEIGAEKDDELGLYLDPELELDSKDERIAAEDERAQAMDSEESSEEPSGDSSESSDPDWEP
ncbi:uncharacterized protein LOC130135141 [Syzygium oleosum]|uniref:uncharacterized protein LOC130135141 n=1 Tax=Syzygium oleosum TaxID=219896 RepID=UPI0024BA3C50|nr:uncharacterized protein LOC130135141 [Syzygium oleosum]